MHTNDDRHTNPQPANQSGLTITNCGGAAGEVRLVAVGHLDYAAADDFYAAVLEAFDAGARAVTVDVAGIEFSDSSGLAAVIRAHKTAARLGCGFSIADPDDRLTHIFAITALNQVLHVIRTPAPGNPGAAP
ncbi:STAS domain-containing protein [Dactylosporangium sp. NPDC049742]|uniref:STAS domain-containing protein n=1 Tax=Dactylosporangium sp. NPDC049742 TaxID=3154737 RepID=UPI0034325367